MIPGIKDISILHDSLYRDKKLVAKLYEIAKTISSDYNGTLDDEVFRVDKKQDWVLISSSKCDWCPSIRVYVNEDKITVCGDYTDGWDDIQPSTMSRVKALLKSGTSAAKDTKRTN